MPKMTSGIPNGRLIKVDEALRLRDGAEGRTADLKFTCTECGQAVRAHKGSSYAAAHFEHRERNESCSQISVRRGG